MDITKKDKKCACEGKTVIGRKTDVVFGGFLKGTTVKAKVDTGAYTGALHVEDISEKDGVLYFRPLSEDNEVVSTTKYRTKWVMPTSGEKHTRYVITVPATVHGLSTKLELTLANRTQMKFDMLIGRKNLRERFVVDIDMEVQS